MSHPYHLRSWNPSLELNVEANPIFAELEDHQIPDIDLDDNRTQPEPSPLAPPSIPPVDTDYKPLPNSDSSSDEDEMATNNQRPDSYNGFGSPSKFFEKFEDWMAAKDKPQSSWMAQLKPFLKGAAYRKLVDLITAEEPAATNYELFKKEAVATFQDPRAKWVKTWAVRIKQKKHQSVQKYAESFQKECDELDLDLESEGIKTSFVKGLQSQYRSEVLKSGDIGTFSKLLKAALVAEMALNMESDDSAETDDENSRENHRLKKEIKSLRSEMAKLRVTSATPSDVVQATCHYKIPATYWRQASMPSVIN